MGSYQHQFLSPVYTPFSRPQPCESHKEAAEALPPLQEIQNVRVYHLEQNPCEKTDLSGLFPAQLRSFLDRMEEYWKTAAEPWWPEISTASCPERKDSLWKAWMDP